MKIKNIIKRWLLKEELDRLSDIEKQLNRLKIAYKDQIDSCIEKAEKSIRMSTKSEIEYDNAKCQYEKCRKLISSIIDTGVDVGFHSEEHSWAVVCVAGKKEYVKFIPLSGADARSLLNFIKTFKYSNIAIDSPFAFRKMVENEIFDGKYV